MTRSPLAESGLFIPPSQRGHCVLQPAMACRSCRSCLQLLPRQPASIGARTSRHASVLQRSPPSRSPGVQSRGLHGTAARRSAETSQLQHIIKSRKTGVARRILNWFPKYADAAHLYGATEPLYRSFASQADYEISPEDRRNGTVKRLEGGEEVGTGQGPWHDGTFFCFPPWQPVAFYGGATG